MSQNEEKDRFKFKTWVVPLPDFHFVHQTYNQSSDHRDFFGREKDVQDFVEVLQNTRNTSGSYLVAGYRGAGKTSFVKKVMAILSNGKPKLASYNNFFSKLYSKIKNFIIEHLPKVYDLIKKIKIGTGLIVLLGLLYVLFLPLGWWDFIVLPFLFMLHYFNKHGFAALYPPQWYKWIFHPVVQIPVNLGYDIKNTKNVIFSIISLLRHKYIEYYNSSLLLLKIISPIILIILSAILAITTYRLFPKFHGYMETKMYVVVFGTHELVKVEKLCSSGTQNYKNQNEDEDEDEKKNENEVSDRVLLPHLSEADKWYLKFGKIKVLELKQAAPARSGEVSFIREIILVSSYCAVSNLSKELFDYEHWKNTDSWYLLDHIALPFVGLKELVTYFDSKGKEFNPRPYHVLHFLLIFILLVFLRVRLNPIKRIIRRLDDIHKRIQASEILNGSGMPGSSFPFWRKKYQHFQRLDERQAEELLLQVLEENANNFLIQPHIIFLFDELDKIQPHQEKQLRQADETTPIELGLSESVRQRQSEIEQLLGSLKNIITTAPCNFIFVAGREMLDANLADRGETRFLHGTLFDRVFYVPSFLTDPSDENREDISSMIEQYVCRRLMSSVNAKFSYSKLQKTVFDADNYKYWSLKTYMQYLENNGIDKYHRFRLITLLQDFIYFLSYRSGGNAQKLALQFEEFLRPLPKAYSSRADKYHQVFTSPMTKFVLHFDAQDQYRIQLIGHLFSIFHGSYSKLVSQYGDKLSVSLFSILDYIFKFHSMGFSRRELECMPGALDIHRAPALPQIIELLLDRILASYNNINKIDNGFYNFRFARHIQREIVYISQFSEQEMAAFNFSLDESIQIKQHYRHILNEQMRLYKKEMPIQAEKETQGTYVFAGLHMILGDLHAQDNEFDQAMVEYENAIYHLDGFIGKCLNECKNQKDENGAKTSVELLSTHFIFYVRIMLKRGLLQERRMIYDSAIGFYYRAMKTVSIILKSDKGKEFFDINIEQLNLLIQPYLCLAFLHAKRDYSLEAANRFMRDALELIEGKKSKSLGCSQSKSLGCDTFAKKSGQIYKHHVRWAEMWMMRSQFKEAICQYLKAMKVLYECDPCNNKNKENALTCHDMGSILAGLADACTALALYALYENKDEKFELILPAYKNCDQGEGESPKINCAYNRNLSDEELKESLNKNVESIMKWQRTFLYNEIDNFDTNKLKPLFNNALCLYVLASHAYRLAGSLSDEAFMLWKTANAVALGLSYIKKVRGEQYLTPDKKAKIDWLFIDETNTKEPRYQTNPIRHVFYQAFAGSYSVHRARLKEYLGVKDKRFLRWISSPLIQLFTVLSHFWQSYWGDTDVNGNPCKMDESAFEIVDMGTFPMKARILALYLKGRWYQEYAAISENEYQYKEKAFRLLVQAIEDGQAFEGELDYIALPLGIIYYHIWEIVKENDDDNRILRSVKEDEYFKGDMQRYFSSNYCRNRTKKRLLELLSRHNIPGINKERYFTYMSKQYYLYDAFSDPYVNGKWALEYGLVPVAKFMLDEINKDSDDMFF
ncbi:MAG: ATP-binding protein [Pseudomonadota bacterium]